MVIKTPLVVVEQKLIVAGHYTTILYLQEQQLSLLVYVLNPENTAFLCRVQTDNVCLQSKFLQHAE